MSQSVTAEKRRRFTLLDALVLIAALAVGFAWASHWRHSDSAGMAYPGEEGGPVLMHRIEVAAWWAWGLSHCAAAVTIALVALRLRGPRMPLGELAREPGTVACTAVLLAAVADVCSKLNYLAYWATGDRKENPFSYIDIALTPRSEFLGVAAAWSVLAACGLWRPQPGWIDRAGACLGIYWLAAPPLYLLGEVSGAITRYVFSATS
jgi:hypothetical protein